MESFAHLVNIKKVLEIANMLIIEDFSMYLRSLLTSMWLFHKTKVAYIKTSF